MNILCVCLSATIQRTLTFDSLAVDKVNRTRDWREDASGKAVNSQRVIQELAASDGSKVSVTSLCPLGRQNARHFLRLTRRDGLKTRPVLLKGATRLCLTLLDRSAHTTTEVICDESGYQATARDEVRFLKAYSRCLKKADAVLIAGSRGPFTEEIYGKLCLAARNAEVPVFADFCGQPLKKALDQWPVDFIKINEEEFIQTFGAFLRIEKEEKTASGSTPDSPADSPESAHPLSESELLSAISRVSSHYDTAVIVTRGNAPTLAASPNEKTFICPAMPLSAEELVNTTACGDSFSAGFLYDFLRSHSMESSLQTATFCAAQNAKSPVPGTIR